MPKSTPTLYRLAGMCIDLERSKILEDISQYAFSSGGRQLDPRKLEVVVWLLERWPWVKKNLDDLVRQKEQINEKLGALK